MVKTQILLSNAKDATFSQPISQFVDVAGCDWCNVTFTWIHYDIIFIVHQSQHATSAVVNFFYVVRLIEF